MDEPAVWTELAHAQLDHGEAAEAIASYLRAGDSSRYADVIARSQEVGCYDELVKYLLMVRKKVKDNKVSLPISSLDPLILPRYSPPCCSVLSTFLSFDPIVSRSVILRTVLVLRQSWLSGSFSFTCSLPYSL